MEFKQDPLEDHYEIGDEIGSGQFAVVRKTKHRVSGEEYAAKFIRKKRAKASRRGVTLEVIQREVAVLTDINHDNIVKLYEVYEDKQDVILVMELVSGGELFEYLAEKEKVCEAEAVAFLKQILDGVKYMHSKTMVHLDLKPENLMLLNHNSNRLKIIDFGLSRYLKCGEDCRELLGTPEFVAPEVINYDPLCMATDMWSIGVITYILLSGCSPFLGDNKQETLSNVSAMKYDFDSEHFTCTSDLAKQFIRSLLVKEPKHRATVHECLSHAWINPVDSTQVRCRRSSSINLDNLKNFIARNKWKQYVAVITICNHLIKKSSQRRALALERTRHLKESFEDSLEDSQCLDDVFTASPVQGSPVRTRRMVTSSNSIGEGPVESNILAELNQNQANDEGPNSNSTIKSMNENSETQDVLNDISVVENAANAETALDKLTNQNATSTNLSGINDDAKVDFKVVSGGSVIDDVHKTDDQSSPNKLDTPAQNVVQSNDRSHSHDFQITQNTNNQHEMKTKPKTEKKPVTGGEFLRTTTKPRVAQLQSKFQEGGFPVKSAQTLNRPTEEDTRPQSAPEPDTRSTQIKRTDNSALQGDQTKIDKLPSIQMRKMSLETAALQKEVVKRTVVVPPQKPTHHSFKKDPEANKLAGDLQCLIKEEDRQNAHEGQLPTEPVKAVLDSTAQELPNNAGKTTLISANNEKYDVNSDISRLREARERLRQKKLLAAGTKPKSESKMETKASVKSVDVESKPHHEIKPKPVAEKKSKFVVEIKPSKDIKPKTSTTTKPYNDVKPLPTPGNKLHRDTKPKSVMEKRSQFESKAILDHTHTEHKGVKPKPTWQSKPYNESRPHSADVHKPSVHVKPKTITDKHHRELKPAWERKSDTETKSKSADVNKSQITVKLTTGVGDNHHKEIKDKPEWLSKSQKDTKPKSSEETKPRVENKPKSSIAIKHNKDLQPKPAWESRVSQKDTRLGFVKDNQPKPTVGSKSKTSLPVENTPKSKLTVENKPKTGVKPVVHKTHEIKNHPNGAEKVIVGVNDVENTSKESHVSEITLQIDAHVPQVVEFNLNIQQALATATKPSTQTPPRDRSFVSVHSREASVSSIESETKEISGKIAFKEHPTEDEAIESEVAEYQPKAVRHKSKPPEISASNGGYKVTLRPAAGATSSDTNDELIEAVPQICQTSKIMPQQPIQASRVVNKDPPKEAVIVKADCRKKEAVNLLTGALSKLVPKDVGTTAGCTNNNTEKQSCDDQQDTEEIKFRFKDL